MIFNNLGKQLKTWKLKFVFQGNFVRKHKYISQYKKKDKRA